MADIAEYGVKIRAPEGVDQNVAAFRKIDDAAARTGQNVSRHLGTFEKLTASFTRNATGAMTMLRTLGPLGGEAVMLAERLERAAVRGERLASMSVKAASGQRMLEAAHKSGTIAAATMEAAQVRLTAARDAAIAVEQRFARAQAASRVAQEEARIASSGVKEQRLITSSVSGRFASYSPEVEREQRRLTQAQNEAIAASNAARAAAAEERMVKGQLAAANAEVASSQKLLTGASAGFGAGLAGTTLVVAGLVTVLIGLATVIYAAHKAWQFFRESLAAGAKVQAASVSLKLLIGNATAAKEVFEELNQLDLQTGIGEKELLGAATQLYGIGIGLDDLVEKTKQLANVSAVLDRPIDAAVSAYIRLFEMIGSTGRVQARTLTAFAQQGFDILLVLSQATGKTREEVAQMVKDGEIGIKQIDEALALFSKNDFIGARSRTWEGIGRRITSIWEEVHEVFGRPIIDRIGPILDRLLGTGGHLSPMLETLLDDVGKVGERVADLADAFAKIAADDGWRTAIKAAWEVLIAEISSLIKTSISKAFTETFTNALKVENIPFNEIPRSMVNAFNDERAYGTGVIQSALVAMFAGGQAAVTGKVVLAGQETAKAYVDGSVNELESAKSRLKSALDALWEGPRSFADVNSIIGGTLGRTPFDATATPPGESGAIRHKSIIPTPEMGGRGRESDWEKYKTDIKVINDHWEEYAIIQSKAATETERTRRVIEAEVKMAHELVDPAAYLEAFTTIEGKWAAMEEARLRKAEEIDTKIKMGTASVSESMIRGFEKAMESWGNLQTKMSKFAEDALNRIGDGFADAFGDVITGAKSAGDAFRDMAVSMLEDIARLIIKMLVLQAIQYALGYFGVGGGTTTTGFGGGARGATGGSIVGPSHASGGVNINAEGGEFMLRKEAVRNQKMEDLYALNAGRAMIVKRMDEGGPITGIADRGSRIFHRDFNGPALRTRIDPGFPGSNPPSVEINPGLTPNPTPSPSPTTPPGTPPSRGPGPGGYRGPLYGGFAPGTPGYYAYMNSLSAAASSYLNSMGGGQPGEGHWRYYAYHTGGIIGLEGTPYHMMAGGGEVPMVGKTGEGVFTRGQMAAIGAGMSGGGKVEVNVNVDSHDNVTTSTATGSGLDAEDWKQLGRAVGQMVDQKLADGKRFRGALNPA